jgi:hypothetical protein
MTNAQVHTAMQIARNFEKANKSISVALNSISNCLNESKFALTLDDLKAFRDIEKVLDNLHRKTNEWEAGKYAEQYFEREAITDANPSRTPITFP